MKDFFKKPSTWIAINLIGILAFIAIPKCTEVERREPATKIKYVHITDTVYIEKIKVITVSAPIKPAKIIIQKVLDTVYRKEVENKNIIIGELIEKNKIHIQTIDSLGRVKETVTDIPKDIKGLNVDQEGNVDVKKRTKTGEFIYKAGKVAKKVGKGALYGLATVGAVAIVLIAGGN